MRPSQTINRRLRHGLSLVEVMIATSITLLMLLALAQGFKKLSETVSEGRSRLNLSDQLRGISALLRSDLEGCTTSSATPQSILSATGYFKYYDGPLFDSSATLFNHVPSATTVEGQLSASRWGDIDDILMMTVKAQPGQVFRGKVPWALLILNRMNKEAAIGNTWIPSPSTVPGWTGWPAAWNTDVTISSEYAEIVWFMLPLNGDNTIDPTNPDEMVFDAAGGNATSDGMPDRIALCRRVLLIRPDLDITASVQAFVDGIVVKGDYATMQPLDPRDGSNVSDTQRRFRFMMQFPYQRCDLSLRPQLVTRNTTSFISIKTNSVEDLQQPENRFAHYTFPIATAGTTLPSLVLSAEPNAIQYRALTDPSFQNIGLTINASLLDRGFLPSSFMRTRGGVANPTLEEIVSANATAFDLKGFDGSAKQLYHPGPDGIWGLDGSAAQAGWPGSDDVTVGPSDPGYAIQLATIAQALPGSRPNFERQSTTGAYVDVGWGSKLLNATIRNNTTSLRLSGLTSLAGVTEYFESNLSMVNSNATNDGLVTSPLLLESGSYVDPTLHQCYQPAFDTFTDAYEVDGEIMGNRIRTGTATNNQVVLPGLVWRGGLTRFAIPVSSTSFPDPSQDGIGDDSSEKDTIPMIPYAIPSIQATIRVQDITAGTLQQVSVIHDLTN